MVDVLRFEGPKARGSEVSRNLRNPSWTPRDNQATRMWLLGGERSGDIQELGSERAAVSFRRWGWRVPKFFGQRDAPKNTVEKRGAKVVPGGCAPGRRQTVGWLRDRGLSNFLWFKNYRLLRRDSYPAVTFVNFNKLMELDVELSSDFFDRFPRIQELIATGPVERDRFEWFLLNATAVRELELTNTSLDQTFMDRLPKMNSRLTGLEVNESSRLITDFNFVLQFEQLQLFETDRELGSLDLAAQAFRQLNELQIFHFRAGSEIVQIDRLSSIKSAYNLEFTPENCGASTRPFCKKNLKWTELVALYDQRRATHTAGKTVTRPCYPFAF